MYSILKEEHFSGCVLKGIFFTFGPFFDRGVLLLLLLQHPVSVCSCCVRKKFSCFVDSQSAYIFLNRG